MHLRETPKGLQKAWALICPLWFEDFLPRWFGKTGFRTSRPGILSMQKKIRDTLSGLLMMCGTAENVRRMSLWSPENASLV